MARIVERETAIGAAVLAVGALILASAYGAQTHQKNPGYDLVARFAKADGIEIGSSVYLAGVPIGHVVSQGLDDRFRAVLTLRIDPKIKFPTDSAALVETDGLLGAKFVAIQPGADENDLKPGAEFRYTQGSMNVADILELIVSQAENKRGTTATPPADADK